VSDPRKPGRKDCTEYLVLRCFPHARAIEFPPSLSAGSGRGASPELQALAGFRAELAALSAEELSARYDVEKQREHELLVAKVEKEERERFFNQPYAAHARRRQLPQLGSRSNSAACRSTCGHIVPPERYRDDREDEISG
jgi:hypothetical protein